MLRQSVFHYVRASKRKAELGVIKLGLEMRGFMVFDDRGAHAEAVDFEAEGHRDVGDSAWGEKTEVVHG